MSKITWTHSLRVQLFTALNIRFPTNDVDTDGKPYGMSRRDFWSELEKIGIAMGLGAGKGGALANQISWAYRTPKMSAHTGLWNNHWRNYDAALEAGYFFKEPIDDKESFNVFLWLANLIKQLFTPK